jgi:two-component system, cell cycle sensor histidine kinase and response regulator CckA
MSSRLFAPSITPVEAGDPTPSSVLRSGSDAAVSLRGIVQLNLQLALESDPRHLLDRCGETIRRIFGAHYAMFGLVTPQESGPRLFASGLDRQNRAAVPARWTPQGALAQVLIARRPIRAAAMDGVTFGLPPGLPPTSTHLAVGIRAGGKDIAWLCLSGSPSAEGFSRDDELLLSSMAGLLGNAYQRLSNRDRDSVEELGNHIPEVFWSMQVEPFSLLYVSPAYEELWGRSLKSLYESPSSWMDAIVPEDRAAVSSAFERQLEGTGTLNHEYRIERPDGTLRWIWDRGFPVRGGDGRIERVTGMAIDVTDRKNLELQLRHAQKMEAVGRLAGGVAHDFNNLLGVVMGNSEAALRLLPAGHPARAKIEQVLQASERAAGVTRQLLGFSRKQAANTRILDVNALLGDMERMLRSLIGEDIVTSFQLEAGLGRIKADPGELEQVIMNLAVNARDAMPQGGHLTLRTENADRDEAGEPGRYVVVRVQDTGTGIPRDVQERIFEPFFTTKEEGKGTGLGLATVYRIVVQAGGRIFVHSEPGRRTTFNVYFPTVDAHTAPRRARGRDAVTRGSESVLLVEDDEMLRAVIAETLEAAGYSVLAAADGGAALRISREHAGSIDLLITDIVMPGIDGRAVAETVANERPAVLVIYISGYTAATISSYGLAADAILLSKPFGATALTSKVREVLDAGRERRPSA